MTKGYVLETRLWEFQRPISVLIGIFVMLVLIVLCIGYLYDRVFSYGLRKEVLILKRNPFWTYALSPMFMMNMALTAENLKRNCPEDKEMQEQMDWILDYCKSNADTEMWARTVQHWDKHIRENSNILVC